MLPHRASKSMVGVLSAESSCDHLENHEALDALRLIIHLLDKVSTPHLAARKVG